MSAVTKAKTLGNVGITVAAILALGVAALMFVPGVLGFDRYVITGGSMSGTFERGALVFERQVPISDLRVGDVITYLPPADSGVTELVTHRISSIEPSPDAAGALMFQTKGDANANVDPWTFTLADTVQPRVEGWVPEVGWVFIALAEPMIRMLAIGVPGAVIALLCLSDLVRATRRPSASPPATSDHLSGAPVSGIPATA